MNAEKNQSSNGGSDSEPDLPSTGSRTRKRARTDDNKAELSSKRSAMPSSSSADNKARKGRAQPIDDLPDDAEILDMNFEINSIKESDFHGIKNLLQQLFWRDMNVHLSEIADLVTSQWEDVGSSISITDSEGVYGVISVINVHQHSDKASIQELIKYLIKKCSDDVQRRKMQSLFGDKSKGLGLIIHERFINIPAQLASPMYTALFDEISSAVHDGEPFKFDNYLIISKTQRPSAEEAESSKATSASKKRPKWESVNVEDVLFEKEAETSYRYGVEHSDDDSRKPILGDGYVDMGRHVLVVPATKIPIVLEKMAIEFPGPWVRASDWTW
eukprot:CFRG5328T1